MKPIKVTHIDTGRHGYYSVSKEDFLKVCTPEQITGYSGHNLNRIYLEEDQDATTFFNSAKEKGITIVEKSSYNLKFKVSHNYNPALFSWKPVIGNKVRIHDKSDYTIVQVNPSNIVVNCLGTRYKISLSNPFQYILPSVDGQEPDKAKVMQFATERLNQLIQAANGETVEANQARARYNAILALSPDEFYQQALKAYKLEQVN